MMKNYEKQHFKKCIYIRLLFFECSPMRLSLFPVSCGLLTDPNTHKIKNVLFNSKACLV